MIENNEVIDSDVQLFPTHRTPSKTSTTETKYHSEGSGTIEEKRKGSKPGDKKTEYQVNSNISKSVFNFSHHVILIALER